MSDATLTAQRRTTLGSRPSGRQRREGLVPGVVYGLGGDNEHVVVPARELGHILASESGANTLITLQVDGTDELALAREIQRHAVRGDVVHVDFVRVDVDVDVSAEVPVHLVGESRGVRDDEGILDQVLFAITVEAKPNNIPSAIEHDVSELEIGDQVLVSDLAVPAGVTVTLEGDETVAVIAVPMAEEAEPVVEELAEGEVPAEGEEEAAEGDEAGDGAGDDSAGADE